jgi:hypothetical protein
MKQLTLALLLSIAPAAINANETEKCGNCDRTEQVATQNDDRCCGLPELLLIDAMEAYEATSATITATNQTMSADCWNFINELLTATFGTPTTQTVDTISFIFPRGTMDVFQWFETLATIEAKLIEANAIAESTQDCTGGTVEFSLSN